MLPFKIFLGFGPTGSSTIWFANPENPTERQTWNASYDPLQRYPYSTVSKMRDRSLVMGRSPTYTLMSYTQSLCYVRNIAQGVTRVPGPSISKNHVILASVILTIQHTMDRQTETDRHQTIASTLLAMLTSCKKNAYRLQTVSIPL